MGGGAAGARAGRGVDRPRPRALLPGADGEPRPPLPGVPRSRVAMTHADPVGWAAPRIAALARGRVLDLGCGDGRFLAPGAVRLDLDREKLRTARERSPLVVQGDAHARPFPDATL